MQLKQKLLAALLLILIGTSGLFAQPYVLLVSFDGFRWDYPSRGITPNLDRFAEEGVNAASLRPVFPSSTFPNHLAIITGMYADNHGIIMNMFEDPYNGKQYSLKDESVAEPRWYTGEAFWTTAKRNGIITASYFWPGSELTAEHRRPDYFEAYEHNKPYGERIDGVIDWLKLPYEKRPHFITLYFHETDSKGHGYGPDSEETNRGIALLDSLLGVLDTKLAAIGMADSVNIILVSDHGMASVSKDRTVNVSDILRDKKCRLQNGGPYMMVRPEGDNLEEISGVLEMNAHHYKVYKKEESPEHLHFRNSPYISPIFLMADPGWLFVTGENEYTGDLKGAHGYDNNWIDMHGIFYAKGPAFKKAYRTGTLRNIDIYPLLCEIFGIQPRANIDGKLENIEFILKNY